MLQAICTVFNYFNNEARKHNYTKFRKHLQCNVITVEVACSADQFFIDDSIKIVASDQNLMWQKERCFNIALERLPASVDKVLWLDTDLIFHDDNWFKNTEKALDTYSYVQPFDRVVENHYTENTQLNCFGYARQLYDYVHYKTKITRPVAAGLSWACRRELLSPDGFFDKHILGANDMLQVIAWTGDLFNHVLQNLPASFIREFLAYYRRLNHCDGATVGYCSGTVEHLYHGDTKQRGYVEREKLLTSFDPACLQLDENGLYMLKDQELYSHIVSYMRERHATTLPSTLAATE